MNPNKLKLEAKSDGKGQLLRAILFEAFPYFQCFRILANFCKTLFDKFYVTGLVKSDLYD